MNRLTEETQIGPFAALVDKAEAVPGAFGTYDCFYAHEMAVTRLKQYEDTGLEPEEIAALLDLPNPPLTLEELRKMGGDDVAWFEFDDFRGMSTIKYANSEFLATWRFGFRLWEEYGKTWLAYRRKPEEGTT